MTAVLQEAIVQLALALLRHVTLVLILLQRVLVRACLALRDICVLLARQHPLRLVQLVIIVQLELSQHCLVQQAPILI